MDKKYKISLSKFVEAQLNESQIKFIKIASQRIIDIDDLLDFELLDPSIRFLYIKELYGIFEELHKIKFKRKINKELKLEHQKVLEDLKFLVSFIRNVLLHFPIFNTWDQVWMSKQFSKDNGGNEKGKIYKFLENSENFTINSFRLTYSDKRVVEFVVKYPRDVTMSKKVYLKDIIPEKDGALAVLSIMQHIF